MTDKCNLCNVILNQPDKPLTEDCGGDCLKCMVDAGDPQAIKRLNDIDRKVERAIEIIAWVGANFYTQIEQNAWDLVMDTARRVPELEAKVKEMQDQINQLHDEELHRETEHLRT